MKINRFIQDSALYRIHAVQRSLERDLARELKPFGLNFIQALVLAAVYFEKDRSIRPTDITRVFFLSKSQTSQLLSHLEAMQFLRRTVDPADARSYRLKVRQEQRRRILAIVAVLERTERAADRLWKAGAPAGV